MANLSRLYLKSLESENSRVSMGSYLNKIARFFDPNSSRDEFDWSQLTYEMVLDFKDSLVGDGKAPNTVNVYLACIKGIAKEAWRQQLLQVDEYMRIKDVKRARGSRTAKGRVLSHFAMALAFGAKKPLCWKLRATQSNHPRYP